jgi:O-6-methylguanine DNA methyltransferase
MSIESQLERLATTAPPHIEPQALLEVGVADGYVSYPGPVGPMWVAFNTRGISAVYLSETGGEFENWFRAFYKRELFPAAALPPVLERRLDKALATGRVGNLPIDWESMSPFQRKVLQKAVEILPGEVRPYSWIAREIGQPKASRAVGTALARNPIPFLIPCHRVVRNDGSLGNYYYGPEMKRDILGQEGLDTAALDDRVSRKVRLTGSDTTKIYCHPTCRDARRVSAVHKAEFRDREAAVAAGYRPCKHCRP